jgi:hypothetical protein
MIDVITPAAPTAAGGLVSRIANPLAARSSQWTRGDPALDVCQQIPNSVRAELILRRELTPLLQSIELTTLKVDAMLFELVELHVN